MKIRFSKRGVWWAVVKEDRQNISTYSFVLPMVMYFLKDQLGEPLPPGVFKWLLFYMKHN